MNTLLPIAIAAVAILAAAADAEDPLQRFLGFSSEEAAAAQNRRSGFAEGSATRGVSGGTMVHRMKKMAGQQVGDDAAECYYPCILQNGCKCNHTKVSIGKDLQFYGTCVRCGEGWGGYDCGSVVSDCLNGGEMVKDDSGGYKCQCTEGWKGLQCMEADCINSVNGTGPQSSVPINATDNQCDKCKEGYKGLACDVKTLDHQCNATAGEKLYTSPVTAGYRKTFACDLTDESFVQLLSSDRKGVKGKIKVEYETKPDFPMANTSRFPLANGYMSVWRLEPNASWLDAFFYCSTKNCSMKVESKTTPAVLQPMPSDAVWIRWIFVGAMCFVLQLIVFNGYGSRNVRNRRAHLFKILGLVLLMTLLAYVLFSYFFGHQVVTPASTKTTVTYECLHSGCKCGKDPPLRSYWPWCIDSTFQDFFIPILKGVSKLICDVDENGKGSHDCTFEHQNLGYAPISLTCLASECSSEKASTAVQRGPPLVNVESAAELSAGIAALIVLGLALHAFSLSNRFASRKKDFIDRFSTPVDDETLPTDSPLRRSQNAKFPTPRTLEREAAQQPNNGGKGGTLTPLLGAAKGPEFSGSGGSLDAPPQPAHHTTDSATATDELVTTLTLRDVSYSVESKQILQNINVTVRSGEMLALMGPSGAGKTSLLDILTQRDKPGNISGQLCVNGVIVSDFHKTLGLYKRMIGYVAQEDTLIAALTVRQTIYFAARLKLPAPISEDTINLLVDDVIEKLRLKDCEDTIVGDGTNRGVSGGEKRRVSIATELIANPRILYLDEPTSGLDSLSAHEVMQAIVSLSRKSSVTGFKKFFDFRPAIVFSIHQPSMDIYKMFDRVMLLARGRALYFGPAQEAVNHARGVLKRQMPSSGILASLDEAAANLTSNPAETLLRLSHDAQSTPEYEFLAAAPSPTEEMQTTNSQSGGAGAREAELYNSDSRPGTQSIYEVPPMENFQVFRETKWNQQYYPNVWQQLRFLSRRSWAALMGSYYLVMAHAEAAVFLTLILSFLYRGTSLDLSGVEDKAGMVMFLMLVTAFSSLSALDLVIGEKKLFIVERENGYYSTLPYFATKILFDYIPLRIVPTAIISASIYFPMGLRADHGSYFLWFVAIMVLFSTFVTGICLCIAIIAPSFGAAALFSSLLILWNTAFGGLMIQSGSIPAGFEPFKYLSPFYYGYEAMMVNILDGLHCVFDPSNAEGQSEGVHVPVPCRQFLYNFGLDPDHFRRDVALLLVGSVATLVLACVLLSLLGKRSKKLCSCCMSNKEESSSAPVPQPVHPQAAGGNGTALAVNS